MGPHSQALSSHSTGCPFIFTTNSYSAFKTQLELPPLRSDCNTTLSCPLSQVLGAPKMHWAHWEPNSELVCSPSLNREGTGQDGSTSALVGLTQVFRNTCWLNRAMRGSQMWGPENTGDRHGWTRVSTRRIRHRTGQFLATFQVKSPFSGSTNLYYMLCNRNF